MSLRLEEKETLKCCCICRPQCGKVQYSKLTANELTQSGFFFVFDWKYPLWANLVQKKSKLVV